MLLDGAIPLFLKYCELFNYATSTNIGPVQSLARRAGVLAELRGAWNRCPSGRIRARRSKRRTVKEAMSKNILILTEARARQVTAPVAGQVAAGARQAGANVESVISTGWISAPATPVRPARSATAASSQTICKACTPKLPRQTPSFFPADLLVHPQRPAQAVHRPLVRFSKHAVERMRGNNSASC